MNTILGFVYSFSLMGFIPSIEVSAQSGVLLSGVVTHPTVHGNKPLAGLKTPPKTFASLYTNVQVSHEATPHVQVEVSVDVSSIDPNRLVAAWSDYRTDSVRVGYAFSSDGGGSWIDGLLPGNIGGFPFQGDPAVAADKTGKFYISFTSYDYSTHYGGVWVAKSGDGGVTWPDTSMKRLDSDTTLDDKPWIATDRTNGLNANNVYVAWDQPWNNGIVKFARSTNAGISYETKTISDVVGGYIGAMPVVGPNGDVYVVWMRSGFPVNFYIDTSKSGGASFGTSRIFGSGNSAHFAINLIPSIWAFPILAANPVSGDLYLTWSNRVAGSDPVGNFDSSDVLFMRSTDYGASWSVPINIISNSTSPALNDQFFPWITVNPAGNRISIMYYDRSDFVNNDSMHIKISTSIDGGFSFTSPVRMTDVPSYPPLASSSFIGDYNGMTILPVTSTVGKVAPIWADSRNGNFDIFTSAADVQIRLRDSIKYNSTLSGKALLENNVVLKSGVTLNAVPGTLVNVDYGYGLTVNGKLNARGTSSQPITFTSSSPSPSLGIWNQIRLNGGPDTLQYCRVKYANFGVYVNDTLSNILEHCMIDSCLTYGLYALNTSVTNPNAVSVKWSSFKHCTAGVAGTNARIYLEQDTLRKNDQQGIQIYNSKIYTYKTRVDTNTARGAYISGTTGRLYLSPEGIANGCNTMNQNLQEIYIASGTAFLGYFPLGGKNNVYNSGTGSGHLINNTTVVPVSAQNCYWSTQANGFIGPVDTTYHSNTRFNCGAGTTMAPSALADIPTPETGFSFASDGPDPVFAWIDTLKTKITSNAADASYDLHILSGLVGPGGNYESALGTSWEDFLTKIQNSSKVSSPLKSLAKLYSIQSVIDGHDYPNAIRVINNTLMEKTADDELTRYCLGERVLAYIGLGDITNARSSYDLMKTMASSLNIDVTTLSILDEVIRNANLAGENLSTGGVSRGNEAAPGATTSIPREFVLLQNYPNPFNPQTSIRYALPFDSYVTLKIYNVLGQEVRTLVDEAQSAGYKTASFDAGSIPSGVYFYRLQSGNFIDVKKMLLVK